MNIQADSKDSKYTWCAVLGPRFSFNTFVTFPRTKYRSQLATSPFQFLDFDSDITAGHSSNELRCAQSANQEGACFPTAKQDHPDTTPSGTSTPRQHY